MTNQYLRPDGRSLDVQRFTRDLAATLGGEALIAESDHMGSNIRFADGEKIPGCTIPGALRLSVFDAEAKTGAVRDRVVLRLYPDDIPAEFASGYMGGSRDCRVPDITVSTARPLNQIANDIKRRLFPEAAAPIRARRERATESRRYKDATTASVAAVRASLPALSVHDGQAGADPTFYVNTDNGLFASGRIQGGTVTIDRSSMPVELFVAALSAVLK